MITNVWPETIRHVRPILTQTIWNVLVHKRPITYTELPKLKVNLVFSEFWNVYPKANYFYSSRLIFSNSLNIFFQASWAMFTCWNFKGIHPSLDKNPKPTYNYAQNCWAEFNFFFISPLPNVVQTFSRCLCAWLFYHIPTLPDLKESWKGELFSKGENTSLAKQKILSLIH